MKVIDLLNKIANGEEVPKKIIAGDSETEYYFDKNLKDYISTRNQEKLFEDEIGKFWKYYLNDEIEILEEEKKIPEKLNKQHFHNRQRQLANKINEIIDTLEMLNDKIK